MDQFKVLYTFVLRNYVNVYFRISYMESLKDIKNEQKDIEFRS